MDLQQFEPSTCACQACVNQCRQPGILAPGDLERIAAHVGLVGDDEFVVMAFEAAQPLPCDFDGNGSVMDVPVIRPKTMNDGLCVFQRYDGRCKIHAVRPFGCSRVNACEGGNEPAIRGALVAIAQDAEYLNLWSAIEGA